VHSLEIKLVVCLDRDETHVLSVDSFGDRFRIEEVVLVGLHKRLHELSRNQLHVLALLSQNPADGEPGLLFARCLFRESYWPLYAFV
jgi:hypothetical protein